MTSGTRLLWRLGGALSLAGSILAAGCETLPQERLYTVLGTGHVAPRDDAAPERAGPFGPGPDDQVSQDMRSQADFYRPGTGVFTAPAPGGPTAAVPSGDITLNFENTNLLEVVKVILGDLLGENYVLDPQVQGTVTLQTSRPLNRKELIPTLELALRMNGAALVFSEGIHHIVPADQAVQGLVSPQLGNNRIPLPRGYSVQVVPLKFISATEMKEILEPFAPPTGIIRVDTERNLLILAGTGRELGGMLETIDVFDVDWLSGLSVALITPDFVDAETLAGDLRNVFGENAEEPLVGPVRFVTIDRLDALLVISPRPEYLELVREWVDRLDRDIGKVGQRLFVYHVQNGKAADLAEVLNQVFEGSVDDEVLPGAELAPGLQPVELVAPAGEGEQPGLPPPAPIGRVSTAVAEGIVLTPEPVRIIPDEINNALVVMATVPQYQQVLAALKQLDIVPLQVLVEATIAEVRLEGSFRLGLEWFFKHNLPDGREGNATLDFGFPELNFPVVPGFTYGVVTPSGRVELVLNALAQDQKVNVISSPNLMVLNNQKASIQVGDQVPVTTQQQQATTGQSNVVNNVEYRDTGVLLTVTPRVNAGGLVTMELQQEVSDVAPGTEAESLTPTIRTRTISSTVAVQSGETVVLGGLIRDTKSETASGIPALYKLPIIGFLFGTQSDDAERTELVVLITPRAVENAAQARGITQEFREKMEALKPLEPPPQVPDEDPEKSSTPAPATDDKSARGVRLAPPVPTSSNIAPRPAQNS